MTPPEHPLAQPPDVREIDRCHLPHERARRRRGARACCRGGNASLGSGPPLSPDRVRGRSPQPGQSHPGGSGLGAGRLVRPRAIAGTALFPGWSVPVPVASPRQPRWCRHRSGALAPASGHVSSGPAPSTRFGRPWPDQISPAVGGEHGPVGRGDQVRPGPGTYRPRLYRNPDRRVEKDPIFRRSSVHPVSTLGMSSDQSRGSRPPFEPVGEDRLRWRDCRLRVCRSGGSRMGTNAMSGVRLEDLDCVDARGARGAAGHDVNPSCRLAGCRAFWAAWWPGYTG